MDLPKLTAASAYTLPASQALQLGEVTAHWGIELSELLSGTHFTPRGLEEPHARISLEDFNRIVSRARELTGEPALGIFIGLRRRVTMYGFLGFAAMSAATLREALELSVKFSSTVTTAVTLSLVVDDELAALRVEEAIDIGDCRDVALFSLLLGLDQIGKALTGREVSGEIQLAMPRPAYVDRFVEVLPRLHFDQPATQLVFPVRALDLPLSTPDRGALRLAQEQCERALRELRLDNGIVERVRTLLANGDGSRSLEEVAASLHMSSRTLKRRLAAHAQSFSLLSDRARRTRALELVATTRLPFQVIAERLGYSSLPNFARAFRRWTAQTPAAHRRAATESRSDAQCSPT